MTKGEFIAIINSAISGIDGVDLYTTDGQLEGGTQGNPLHLIPTGVAPGTYTLGGYDVTVGMDGRFVSIVPNNGITTSSTTTTSLTTTTAAPVTTTTTTTTTTVGVVLALVNFDNVTAPVAPAQTGWTFTNLKTTVAGTGGPTAPLSLPNAAGVIAAGNGVVEYNTVGSADVVIKASTLADAAASALSLSARGNGSNNYAFEITSHVSAPGIRFNKAGTPIGSKVFPDAISVGYWYECVFGVSGTSGSVVLTGKVHRITDNQWLNSSGTWQSGETVALTYTDSTSPIFAAGTQSVTIYDEFADNSRIDNISVQQ